MLQIYYKFIKGVLILKFNKIFFKCFIVLFLILFNFINVFAKTFNDVPKNYWAYNYIENMTNLGIMFGDLSGNFNPDSFISKFDAIKIFARLNGYNQSTSIIDEKEYYNNLLKKYTPLINSYKNKFSKWDSSVSFELAYLLETQIIKQDELDDFIILKEDKENIRALSLEEMAMYLVRIMGMEKEVFEMEFLENIPKLNEDKSNLKDILKIKSVYFLKSLNIIEKNEPINFKKAISKAEISSIITKFLNYTKIDLNENIYKLDNQNKNIYTKFVIIENVYPNTNTIQVKLGYNTKIYKIEQNTKIIIDENISEIQKIQPKSYAEVTFNNNLISEIKINSKFISKSNNYEMVETIYGVVKKINKDSLTISFILLDEEFNCQLKTETIPFAREFKIIKDNAYYDEILIDEIVSLNILNNMIYQVCIEDKNSIFIGNIIKKIKNDNNINQIIIKTIDNKLISIDITENTKINQNNFNIPFEKLNIGDKITVSTEFNKALNIEATSQFKNINGIIKSIKIYEDFSTISLLEKNKINTYYLNNEIFDIYLLKILDSINLKVYSREIKSIKQN